MFREFNGSSAFQIVISLYMVVTGIMQLVTGKLVTSPRFAQKYTEESIKKYSRVSGPLQIIAGIDIFVTFSLDFNKVPLPVVITLSAAIFVLIAILLIAQKKILVKKDEYK